jgi:hypothetical protein
MKPYWLHFYVNEARKKVSVFPDLELEKLVKLFDDKGWSLTYEDLSDLDGTIQFRITSKRR